MSAMTRRNLILTGTLLGALPAATAARADQPRMQSALDHLRAARADLQDASMDKGGHRRRAMTLVDKAIRQVEQGIAFDRRH